MQYRFAGGPLDEEWRERDAVPGRRSTYLDEHGEPVPTHQIEKYRIKTCDCQAFQLYQRQVSSLIDIDGEILRYRWLDEHNPDNHR